MVFWGRLVLIREELVIETEYSRLTSRRALSVIKLDCFL